VENLFGVSVCESFSRAEINMFRTTFKLPPIANIICRNYSLTPVVVPPCIARAMLLAWYKKVGDYVNYHDPLCVLESGNATIEINSTERGRIVALNYEPLETVRAGDHLCVLDPNHTKYYANNSILTKAHASHPCIDDMQY
jgi:hypothetical protein